MVNIDEEEIAEQIRQMEDTDGWQVILKYIYSRVDDCKSRLVESCKPEEVELIREKYRTYKDVLLHVEKLKSPE